jgi:signal transduction histidine kinase/ActR/RegA family two-component response regulator
VADAASSTRRFYKPFFWTTLVAAGVVSALCISRLDLQRLDLRFSIIVAITLLISSRIIIPIPRFSSHISVSDTFIFLILLIYGSEPAILVAGAEAFLSSRRFSKKPITILFNWGCAICSAFITAQVLRSCFGDVSLIRHWPLSAMLIAATCTMALAQYGANSGIVAWFAAIKTGAQFWPTWSKHFLWTSITYFAGASAAMITAKSADHMGFYAVILTAPTVAILFFTYRTYLKNVESAAAQADQAKQHIEELSHYIAEQERIREQFSQIEKLSALGELASGVAHDFNNTLAGILGRAQLLTRTTDPEKIRRGLEIIIKAAEDGANTVKRIQDFARQRKDQNFTLVPVDQILLDVSEITRPRWKDSAEASNIHIGLALEIRSKAHVMGDESELRDVLVNMVFNAIDAMPNGGQLTLRVEAIEEKVVIVVSDSGTGMSPDVRSRIFDPFFTTKGKTGMGLGLAVSFGIIRRHEGTIQVESEVDKGTTFSIVLPVAKAGAAECVATAAAVPANEMHRGSEAAQAEAPVDEYQPNILVVDDEEPVRDLLRDILETEGCRVYLAPGGREALALFDARKFDGVFTDVGMPGMSGWELAQAIRAQNQSIPIAVITGWGEAVGSSKQKEAGVDWVVTKPFTTERICELVQDIRRISTTGKKRGQLAIVAA